MTKNKSFFWAVSEDEDWCWENKMNIKEKSINEDKMVKVSWVELKLMSLFFPGSEPQFFSWNSIWMLSHKLDLLLHYFKKLLSYIRW